MSTPPHTIPKIAIQSIAAGLLMMAFFTLMWAGIGSGNLSGLGRYAVILIFAIPIGMFVVNSTSLFRVAKQFPALISDEDKAEGRRMGLGYGIIFGVEGITIPVVCWLLAYFHHTQYVLPAIALVVGLHFYPMAKIFNRSLDYYLATWVCFVAIDAMACVKYNVLPLNVAYAFLGIGVAMATTAYGMYMLYEGKRLVAGK